MCGRLWQTMNTNLLLQQANAKGVRNGASYKGGTYNMGPTNVIPAIKKYNKFMDNVEEMDIEESNENENNIEDKENISQSQKQNQEISNEDKQQNQEEIQEEKQNLELQVDEEKINNLKEGDKIIDFLKWGVNSKFGMVINVKSEEAGSKPMFKPLINKNRCVVMAEGYYEWDTKKNPHSFKNKDNKTLLIAALYNEEDNVMVLTREAKGQLGKVHQRMPVILNEDEVEKWLDCEQYSFVDVTKDILSRCAFIDNIQIQKLGPKVNNIREKSEKCLMSHEDYIKELDKTGIKKFFKPIQKKTEEEQKKEPVVEKKAPQ